MGNTRNEADAKKGGELGDQIQKINHVLIKCITGIFNDADKDNGGTLDLQEFTTVYFKLEDAKKNVAAAGASAAASIPQVSQGKVSTRKSRKARLSKSRATASHFNPNGEFQLMGTTSIGRDPKPETWRVQDGIIEVLKSDRHNPETFGKASFEEVRSSSRPTRVDVTLNKKDGGQITCYFSTKWADQPNAKKQVMEFLNCIQQTMIKGEGSEDRVNNIADIIKRVDACSMRRRMAQREFSDRRDSPVMVRLLEEIVAAQDD